MKLTYGDIPSGKDAFYTWTSDVKAVGKGKLTITKSVPFDTVNVLMDFKEQGVSNGGYNIKKGDGDRSIDMVDECGYGKQSD